MVTGVAAAQGAELGVGAEPAAGRVHVGQVGGEELAGLVEVGGFGHQEVDERAEGAPGWRRRAGIRHGVHGGPQHHEPPEVTWLPPELEDGEEPELRPPELELELDPVEVEPELVEPELRGARAGGAGIRGTGAWRRSWWSRSSDVDPEELEPVEVDALAVCVDPGRTRATAPAAATLATVTAVVADLTLLRPRSLAAMARWIPSRSLLLM